MFNDTLFEFSTFKLPSSANLNPQTFNEFSRLNHDKSIKRTHLFNGRYENIYIDKKLISTLTTILDFAKNCAKETLNITQNLDVGFWFNDMPPGSVTIPHTHDDDDELLSGAYYIKVPTGSGDLILTNKNGIKVIKPQEGQLILFNANCLHEVTENKSTKKRLSIGMNFGIK